MTGTGSPRRNRVTPLGEIIRTTLRGAWMGNRGILHEGDEIVRSHRSSLWITCRLTHRDWRAVQWQPGHYTVLFFHDEAVALAAGHRPCALCRRPDYGAFRRAWATGNRVALPSAGELDRRLHFERLVRGTSQRRLHRTPWVEVPPGAFVSIEGAAHLVRAEALVPWTPAGYGEQVPRPRIGMTDLITPPSTVAALECGYPVQVDPTAG